MHDLKNEGAGIGAEEMEVVVILARQSVCGGVDAVKREGEAGRLSRSRG
jgi:hypothetical protein